MRLLIVLMHPSALAQHVRYILTKTPYPTFRLVKMTLMKNLLDVLARSDSAVAPSVIPRFRYCSIIVRRPVLSFPLLISHPVRRTCADVVPIEPRFLVSPPHLVGFANGIAQSIVSLARFAGPILGGTVRTLNRIRSRRRTLRGRMKCLS